MVCQRCHRAVEQILNDLKIPFVNLTLGEVQLAQPLNEKQQSKLQEALQAEGFELLGDRKAKTVEKIKNVIRAYIHQPQQFQDQAHLTFSRVLAQTVAQDYTSLSQLFSSVEGITIEKYLIHQRIEKVKELLKYGELNLTEIAREMGYSSVQYLSNQFKRVTGLSPNEFKKMNLPRKGIDSL